MSSFDVKKIWSQVCAKLEIELSPATYNTWIVMNPLVEIFEVNETTVLGIIASPTAFHSTNVKKNFDQALTTALSEIMNRTVKLEYKVGSSQYQQTGTSTSAIEPPAAPSSLPHSSSNQNSNSNSNASGTSENSQTPSAASTFKPISRDIPKSPRVEDLFSPQTMAANTVNQAEFSARSAGLRTDYTFETFAVSGSNEMAHAAATAVSQQPGQAYNPLFLYGDVGVGKTHLMQAIGNNIIKNNPMAKVLYVTGEEFTNQIVSAIQTKKALGFKEKYRSANVFLIDDIQFIAGKNTVQEEFFHTFNAIIKQQGQIILTSDRPPHEIQLLEDRLRSRFEAGLMIDIQQPSFELRTAILLIKAQAKNLSIPMEIAQFIASKVESARKIEGILTKIMSEVQLKKRILSMKLAEELVQADAPQESFQLKVKPSEVIRAVANHYHIKQAVIKGKKRTKEVVRARHIAMYLLYNDLNIAYAETGRWFANRDHTSAMHACKKVDQLLETDSSIKQDVSAIRMSLAAISQ